MSSSVDQGFIAYGARLLTGAAPYDPATGRGGVDDTAHYLARPGIDFLRPWLAIEKDVAFQWPLGIEGYTQVTDPLLGTHQFIGDNKVVLDVLHTGAESITLTGSFPGDSAPALSQALREVVRRVAPRGKILYVPEIMTHAQRVQVSHFECDRPQDSRGRDLTYSIEFQIMGLAGVSQPQFTVSPVQTTAASKGKGARTVKTDSVHNTLRKVALWKLGSLSKWRQIYDLSETWFINHNIHIAEAPNYRLPIGTVLYF